MSLLVRPTRVMLAVLMSAGIVVSRVVAGVGVRVTQVVVSSGRLTVYVDVYGDVLAVKEIKYPVLLVVHLSV